MTNDRSLFVDGEFNTLNDYMITTAGSLIPAISIGNARFDLLNSASNKTEIVLKNCLYVLSLFTNLMSLKKLAANKVHFSTKSHVLTFNDKVIANLKITESSWLVNWSRSIKPSTVTIAFTAITIPEQFKDKQAVTLPAQASI